jgi:hypothetical protein
MGRLPPDCPEHSHAHDLQVILRTTLLLLQDHAPHISEDRSLRNLELALQCAIADLKRPARISEYERTSRALPAHAKAEKPKESTTP